jgi:pimeloyl-ACP methyl ester carboxylesterase
MDYGKVYESLTLPTLVIYGSAGGLVPIDRSRAVLAAALQRRGSMPYELKVFDGADDDIQTPDHEVHPDYLELLAAWASARFAPAQADAK